MTGTGRGGMVDLGDLRAVVADLVRWGLVEDRDGAPHTTTRWREALLAAARKLREVELAGQTPPGPPLQGASERALRGLRVLPEGEEGAHVAVLVALEVRQMPPAMRQLLGLED